MLVILMALQPFGGELAAGTFSGLLAQPSSRARIWWRKSSLLALAMLLVGTAWCLAHALVDEKSGGMPLPEDVRAKMEVAMGTDFSDVRIHVGREASSIGALAYTWGTNIHFAPGQYNPHSLQGQKILGHELWHVVQQKMGRVSNPLGGGVAVVQDHALEAEADRMGIKAALTVLPRKSGDNR